MDVEPSVVKKELLDLKQTVKKANDVKAVARRLNDIGSDHIPTTQYRSGTQIKTELLTQVSDIVANAKQGVHTNDYIKSAQDLLSLALKINPDHVYSTQLIHKNSSKPNFSLNELTRSINKDLQKLD